MNPKYLVGFLFLLVSVLTSVPINSVFAEQDLDKDGIPDAIDRCPNLQEDNESTLDGCPSNFVPWYDEDYDGIEDHNDLCPNLQETYNRYHDLDGCPDIIPGGSTGELPDSDRDGINDFVDSCPTQPETFNDFFDEDGCPDDYFSRVDRDRDAIPDLIDACPTSPETYNKFQDTDGCPDIVKKLTIDSDNDGIEDMADDCPLVAETYNGFEDQDGCPDSDITQPDSDGDGCLLYTSPSPRDS